MTAIHSHPRITTLERCAAQRRDEWIIYATTPSEGFTALHEIDQADTVPRVLERISLRTSLDVEIFSSSLIVNGWLRKEPRG